MDEKIEQILEDGRLAFNQEQLDGMSEEALNGVIAALAAMPEEDDEEGDEGEETHEDETHAPETTAPASNADDEDTVIANEQFEALVDGIQELGGLSALREVVENYRSKTERRVNALVGRMAANDACTLSREQLERMSEDQLISLDQMLTPVDYGGNGPVAHNAGEEELSMPEMAWGNN